MQASQPAQPDPLWTEIKADGTRLDRAIADWRGLSRAAVGRLLDQGTLRCNGRVMGRANKGDLLRAGDRLELEAGAAQGEAPLPGTAAALEVLLQGEGYLVVNKPAGMPVRPHALDEKGTVINAVAACSPEFVGVGEGGLRSGVRASLGQRHLGGAAGRDAARCMGSDSVRRSLSTASKNAMSRWFTACPKMLEPYSETCLSRPTAPRVSRYNAKERAGEMRGGAHWVGGHLSDLAIKRAWSRSICTQVFLHQVRAMMSDLGHPVVGDGVYGDPSSDLTAPRQMLHAKSLAFEEVVVEAPLPTDMQQVIQNLYG